MGLFSGGGFFGSGGKTNSGNTENTNLTTSNAGANDASVGGYIFNPNFGSINAPLELNITDRGAVDSSFDFSGGVVEETFKVVDDAFTFVAGATAELLETIGLNNSFNQLSTEQALEFAAGAQVNSNDNLNSNLDYIYGAAQEMREFEAGLVGSILDYSYNDIADTKSFTAGLTTRVLDDSKESYERNLEAVQLNHVNTLDAVQQSADNSLQFASGAFSSAVNSINVGANKAMDFLTSSASQVLGGLAEFTVDESANNRAYQLDAIETIKDASATDSQQTNDMMFKLALGLIVTVGGGVAIAAWRKGK